MTRPRALLLAAAYAVALALVVMTPIARALNRITVRMYVVWKYDLHLPGDVLPENFGFALNVLLFVPVGVLVAVLLRRRWWVAVLACVALSALIETVQLVPALHRVSSLADVLANGIGGALGVLLHGLLAGRRTDSESRR